MWFLLNSISSYSIIISVIIAAIRYKVIIKSFRPFVIFLFCAFISECVSTYLIRTSMTNALWANIYVLVEFILLVRLFKNWSMQKRKNSFYNLLTIAAVAVWAIDNLIINSIFNSNSIYRIAYSLILIFLSIDEINQIIVAERKSILSNPKFIICIAVLIFFSFKSVIESFIVIDLNLGKYFYWYIFLIFAFINFIANILFAFAALWMPTKQKFSLPY